MDNSDKPTVLLVDDEVNVISALRRTLRSEQYSIESSTDPLQALEFARLIKPAVVVCDMRMPAMNGAELFRELSRDSPDCGRILLTGYADLSSTIAAINDGHIHSYLTKPWNDEALREVIRHQISVVCLRRERDCLADELALKVKELEVLNCELDRRVEARTQEIYQTNLFLEQAYKELGEQFLNSVKVFSNLIEMNSPAMAGHGKRVAELARLIALEMRLPEGEVQDVYVAGLLHDIGKIGLPESALTKPFTLLEPSLRMDFIKHCEKGQNALMALPELHAVASYVACHHERVDGKGFPNGLAGDAIPRGAKILALAEDWDELQMGLVASQKLDQQQTLDFISAAKGKRYDAKVVEALPGALVQLVATPKEDEELLDSQTLVPGLILSRDLCNLDGMLLMAKGRTVSSTLIQYLNAVFEKDRTTLKVYCKLQREPG